MGVSAARAADDAVIRIGGRIFRRAGAEGRSDFHALENEVYSEPVLPLHPPQVWTDVILLAHAVLCPFHRDAALTGKGIYPAIVFVCPFSQDILRDRSGLVQVTKEMHDVLRSRQQRDVPENDNAVEAMVYKSQQAAKQRCEGFHRSSPVVPASATRASDRRPVEIKSARRTAKGKKGLKGKKPQVSFPCSATPGTDRHAKSTDARRLKISNIFG